MFRGRRSDKDKHYMYDLYAQGWSTNLVLEVLEIIIMAVLAIVLAMVPVIAKVSNCNCLLLRGENKGTVKKCTGDSLNPRNTCFKTVNKKTGGLTLK